MIINKSFEIYTNRVTAGSVSGKNIVVKDAPNSTEWLHYNIFEDRMHDVMIRTLTSIQQYEIRIRASTEMPLATTLGSKKTNAEVWVPLQLNKKTIVLINVNNAFKQLGCFKDPQEVITLLSTLDNEPFFDKIQDMQAALLNQNRYKSALSLRLEADFLETIQEGKMTMPMASQLFQFAVSVNLSFEAISEIFDFIKEKPSFFVADGILDFKALTDLISVKTSLKFNLLESEEVLTYSKERRKDLNELTKEIKDIKYSDNLDNDFVLKLLRLSIKKGLELSITRIYIEESASLGISLDNF